MKNSRILLALFMIFPITAYLQNGKGELLATLKSYEQYKSIYLTYTYRSLDANRDTFSIYSKEEILFTRFKSSFYYRIGSLKADIIFNSKFLTNKHYLINTGSKRISVHDPENSNTHHYEKMNNLLTCTRFNVKSLILPLFLSDSSGLYNNRFWQKILESLNLRTDDSLLLNLKLNDNYKEKYYRFDIQFPKFNRGKAYEKWDKFFSHDFIDSLQDLKFTIIYDKMSRIPAEYSVCGKYYGLDEYKIATMGNLTEKMSIYFTSAMFNTNPKIELFSSRERGNFSLGTVVIPPRSAYFFIEKDYLNNQLIKLETIKSEYILLYLWNSQETDTTVYFKQLCKIAERNPAKLTIIGANSINESKEYIERVYQKTKWKFPTIKGRDIAKYYNLADSPVLILIYYKEGKHVVDNLYQIFGSKSCLSQINGSNETEP